MPRTLPLFLLGLLLALLAAAPVQAFAAPPNDDFAGRLTIQPGILDTRTNEGATVEPDEPLTPAAAAGCSSTGLATAGGGARMASTLWWEFTGDGGPMTVSTAGSNFDTVLAVYESQTRGFVGCNDDIHPYDPTQPNLQYQLASEVVVQTVAGRTYAVQVGGCTPKPPCAHDTTTGTIALRISPKPAGDDRAGALEVAAGAARSASNRGATEEPGEVLSCRRFDDRTAPYAKTLWFRYRAPEHGTATFSASGVDTVLAVYKGAAAEPIGCNDDAVDGVFGPSRLPMSQPAGPPVHVEPGDYLIQVGGYHDPGFSRVSARSGVVTVQVEFEADLDRDDDGVARDGDCNDGDAAIRPGAQETVNDDVDENCDGIKAYDRDGDGALAPAAGADCRDDDPRVRPGAPEVAGNGVDEDCSGQDLPDRDHDDDGVEDPPYADDCDPTNPRIRPGAKDAPENGIDEDCRGGDQPLPRLDLTWDFLARPAGDARRLMRLSVAGVDIGDTIAVRCRGSRRCAARSARRRIVRSADTVSLLPTVRRSLRGRRPSLILPPGLRLEVRVYGPGVEGTLATFAVRRGKPIEVKYRAGCLTPAGSLRRCIER